MKREAISEVLLNRFKKPPLDNNARRSKLFERIEQLIVKKNIINASPIVPKENSETDIEQICDENYKAMQKYKILPIFK